MSKWTRDVRKWDEWNVESRKSVRVEWADRNGSKGWYFDSVTLIFGSLEFEYYQKNGDPYENCPECGMVHKPEAPHYPFDGYFERFTRIRGRFPHWSDATKHCPTEIRAAIKEFLDLTGKWSEPKEDLPLEEATARTLGELPVHSQVPDPKANAFVFIADAEEELQKAANLFVGQPNDEKTRAQIAEAMEQVLGRNTRVNAKAVGDKVELDITLMPEMAADRVEIVYREEKDDEDEEGQSDGNP